MDANEIRQSFLDFFRDKEHSIVPSASLLPTSPNLLFTNAGMNQFVPYFLGQETPPYRPARAADTQKCIRAGGKHNDLDDVGFDTYHHTFFEMLGNWSFGDYFKKEAIAWAWQLLVERWGFPAARLYATVYRPGPGDPAEFDREAHDCWAERFRSAGLDPEIHILGGNRNDNFWMMGDTGPCGPCSEIHIDLTPAGDTEGRLVNQGNPLCMEIWNLVFIQFNANPDGSFSALPARHVDTGMGFERVAGIIACTDDFKDFTRPISNYGSGVFRSLFDRLTELSGRHYQATLPHSRANLTDQEKIDVAFRVIADHIRTLAFSIADGIVPSNTDRNYVLRRILRRAVLFGRYLGFGSEGFLSAVVPTVVENFGDTFPELRREQKRIGEVLDSEEALFNRTLDRGLRLFEEELSKIKGQSEFPAAAAFRLYDTYGFPVDLTEVLVCERGMHLDLAEVERHMETQRERSRAAQEKEVISTVEELVPTEFVGFQEDEADGQLVAVIHQGTSALAAVDRSPFYADMGGQVGDTGQVILPDQRSVAVTGTVRQGRTFLLKLGEPIDLKTPATVRLEIDRKRRREIEANHTATHLFHWALHEVVGPEASQKGSYVGPDRLRFDFNSAPLTPEQLRAVELLVTERVIANDRVTWTEVPFDAVKARKDVMQFFGEKYGESVRVVQIGGHPGALDGYSMELCGGTHVRQTGQIGSFKIVGEGAISAGVRRIEALTGLTAFAYFADQLEQRNSKIDELTAELLELRKSIEKERAAALQREADQVAAKLTVPGQKRNLVEIFEDSSGDFLQAVANALRQRQFTGAAILFGKQGDRVHVLVLVDASLTQRAQAGKIVQELTGLLGGKGGGRPDLARGVGNDVTKLNAALLRAQDLVAGL
jgi:alanyl-tRNA synthetase